MRGFMTWLNIGLARGGARYRARWLPAIAVGVLCCIALEPCVDAAPRLEAENETVDLGGVTRGEVIEADFVIHNTGDEILRITHVNPG